MVHEVHTPRRISRQGEFHENVDPRGLLFAASAAAAAGVDWRWRRVHLRFHAVSTKHCRSRNSTNGPHGTMDAHRGKRVNGSTFLGRLGQQRRVRVQGLVFEKKADALGQEGFVTLSRCNRLFRMISTNTWCRVQRLLFFGECVWLQHVVDQRIQVPTAVKP